VNSRPIIAHFDLHGFDMRRLYRWIVASQTREFVMTESTAKLEVGGKSPAFSIRTGSVGPAVIDIGKLYAQTGMFTYDPGFTSTASCESRITFIDGDEGVLLHRGYPIEQLAEHSDFLGSATFFSTAICQPRRRRRISTIA
jgi:hypothetical protein